MLNRQWFPLFLRTTEKSAIKPNFFNEVGNYLILLFILTQKEAKKSSPYLARLLNVC